MTPDEYQQTVGELARRARMPEGVAARMEEELARAFEPAAAPPEDSHRRVRFGALAAAAAVILAAGAAAWHARQEPVTSNNVTRTLSSPTSKASLKAGTTEKAGATEKAGLKAGTTTSAHLQVGRHAAKLPPVIRPVGFVAVPTAAGLPQFESGLIVRISLPVTALPAYGVDISPASSGEPVEADVLVGQDGLPRAIRLVNNSRSQQ